LSSAGKSGEAIEAHRKSLAIYQKLVERHPAVTDFQIMLAMSQNNLGSTLSITGKPEEALEAFRKALAINQKLADAHPTVPECQIELARAHNNLGRSLARQKQFPEAFT